MSGGVQIGDANFFGIRATLLPEVRIGSNNVIQAGMIVDKDVGNHETVFYKYKERIQLIQA
jgi:acetyltransferase-like isoleucine patch superfamily enzyme